MRHWVALIGTVLLLSACTSAPPDAGPGRSDAAGTPCGQETVRLVVPTEIYGALARVLADAGCDTVVLDRLSGVEALADPGDLWIDDQRWTAGLTKIAVVTTSPLVLVSRGRPCGGTWREIVESPRLRLGDPEEDSAALITLAMAVGPGHVGPWARPIVRAFRRNPARAHSVMVERAEDVASQEFGPGGCTVVTEQAALRDGRSATVSLPRPATVSLRYELVAPGERPPPAAGAIATVLTTPAAHAALADALLRPPDGSPVPGGVGEVDDLEGPTPAVLDRVEDGWRRTVSRG